VEWSGFIDKRKDVDIFIKKVSECDVGCLLSRADAAPIALREFQALGLAVLGTTAGGAYESVCLEAGWLVTPQDSHETIARMIIDVCEDKEKLEMAKNAAWNSRRSFLYDETVRQIFDVMKEKYRACS
jgi:glycosyltransferase involved in cell wall biosynthesis